MKGIENLTVTEQGWLDDAIYDSDPLLVWQDIVDIINFEAVPLQLYGTSANDTLYGSTGDDQIYGLEGDDELHGGDGNDTISACSRMTGLIFPICWAVTILCTIS